MERNEEEEEKVLFQWNRLQLEWGRVAEGRYQRTDPLDDRISIQHFRNRGEE